MPENSRILICGAARNVENDLRQFYRRTSRAFSAFKNVEFVFCESFSSDETVRVLRELETENVNITMIRDLGINNSEPRRTVRIASARQCLRAYAEARMKDFDYVAMMDLDGVNRGLTQTAILSAWSYSGWDAVTANQPLRYYDIWALRADAWSEGDCWREYTSLLNAHSPRKAKRIAITQKMRSPSPKSKPIEVRSAFGGLAIYRIDAFLSGQYAGVDENGEEVCEHVPFHEEITKSGYRIFLLPSLINLSWRNQIVIQIKGSVLYFLEAWKKITTDKRIKLRR
jgi:hypothetical protein